MTAEVFALVAVVAVLGFAWLALRGPRHRVDLCAPGPWYLDLGGCVCPCWSCDRGEHRR